MITVLFFARVRDQLGCDRLELEWPETGLTVSELTHLLRQREGRFEEVLSDSCILVAVNQDMANEEWRLQDGDEIAYFPPVSGG